VVDRGREIRPKIGQQHIVALRSEGVPVADQDIVAGLAEARAAADLEPAIAAGQEDDAALGGRDAYENAADTGDRDGLAALHRDRRLRLPRRRRCKPQGDCERTEGAQDTLLISGHVVSHPFI